MRPAPHDLLAYLRSPGCDATPRLADRLEDELRRAESRSADEARRPVARHRGLAAGRARPTSGARGAPGRRRPRRWLDAARTLLAARRAGAAPPLLRPRSCADAACSPPSGSAAAGAARACEPGDAGVAPRRRSCTTCSPSCEVPLGGAAAGGGVLSLDPLDVRARRFRRVFLVRPAGGRVPAPRPRPSRSSADEVARPQLRPAARAGRRAGRRALPLPRLRLARRASVLTLSWRSRRRGGQPRAALPFCDDCCAARASRAHRGGAAPWLDVAWPAGQAPTRARRLGRAPRRRSRRRRP